jgi:hypothetical protein
VGVGPRAGRNAGSADSRAGARQLPQQPVGKQQRTMAASSRWRRAGQGRRRGTSRRPCHRPRRTRCPRILRWGRGSTPRRQRRRGTPGPRAAPRTAARPRGRARAGGWRGTRWRTAAGQRERWWAQAPALRPLVRLPSQGKWAAPCGRTWRRGTALRRGGRRGRKAGAEGGGGRRGRKAGAEGGKGYNIAPPQRLRASRAPHALYSTKHPGTMVPVQRGHPGRRAHTHTHRHAHMHAHTSHTRAHAPVRHAHTCTHVRTHTPARAHTSHSRAHAPVRHARTHTGTRTHTGMRAHRPNRHAHLGCRATAPGRSLVAAG